MGAIFVALDELLPYVHAANQDFAPYLVCVRDHAETIDKGFRFRPTFMRRLNQIKRVHGVQGVLDVLRAQYFSTRFLSTIAETVHDLYWTPALEQWLLHQFDSDNETGVLYRALIDSVTPVDREVTTGITLATYFADFFDFRSKLIKKLHGCATFHSLVHKHVKNLKIAPSNPSMARNYLPEQTNARVEAAAMVAREELTTLDTLRRHLEAVDADFAAMTDVAKRRAN
eukprot:jgi/Tetstr1/457621/TSEL_044188.t1